MPRPYWSGFLRLSLVSCPIYLTPATSERDLVHLHQLNPETGNRIRLQPVDAETGEALDRVDLVKGFEVEKGRYVQIGKDELDALKIESSRVLELTRFVEHGAIDPLYLDARYFVYPENSRAAEAYDVIAAAIQSADRVGLGRVVLAQREHPVMLEAYRRGLLMSTLRTVEEVREAEFSEPAHKLDPEMIEVATSIIKRMDGRFDPKGFHDQYQDALRDLIQAKSKGKRLPKARVEEPSNVVDLMAVLKKSLNSTKAPTEKKRRPARKRA
jgi:DNA end-binding protein Ku